MHSGDRRATTVAAGADGARHEPGARAAQPHQKMGGALRRPARVDKTAVAAARGAGARWDAYSDDVLLAQGRFSAAAGRGVRALIDAIPELAAMFETGGVMIDAGVGVAADGCAICAAVPTARVIGLDVNPRALALAREMVPANGLADRVELRLQGVEELKDTAIASLAHISPPFIPRAALVQGLPTSLAR